MHPKPAGLRFLAAQIMEIDEIGRRMSGSETEFANRGKLESVSREAEWNESGAAMSGEYKQMRHGDGEAARKLRERLARREMGDGAFDKAASYHDDRAFKIFGVVFIVVFVAVILGVTWLGY